MEMRYWFHRHHSTQELWKFIIITPGRNCETHDVVVDEKSVLNKSLEFKAGGNTKVDIYQGCVCCQSISKGSPTIHRAKYLAQCEVTQSLVLPECLAEQDFFARPSTTPNNSPDGEMT